MVKVPASFVSSTSLSWVGNGYAPFYQEDSLGTPLKVGNCHAPLQQEHGPEP